MKTLSYCNRNLTLPVHQAQGALLRQITGSNRLIPKISLPRILVTQMDVKQVAEQHCPRQG
jgi:hypothetical protein